MDPRFDKVYQRGYQGETVVPAPVEADVVETGPRPEATTPPATETAAETDTEAETTAETERESFRDLRRANPWLFAIWIVSGALVAGAIVSLVWVIAAFSDPAMFNGPQFIVLLLVPPALFVPGATGILIALAFHATRFRRPTTNTDETA